MGIHRELNLLEPTLKKRVEKLFSVLEEKGFLVLVSETLRDQDVQIAYYAQGRKSLAEVNKLRDKAGLYRLSAAENKYTVTNCDGITHKSNHQARDASGLGFAIDLVPAKMNSRGYRDFWWDAPHNIWEELGEIAESCGLDWCYGGKGEQWKWDMPHFELLKDFEEPVETKEETENQTEVIEKEDAEVETESEAG